MNKENICIHNGIIFIHAEKLNDSIWRKMNVNRDHYTKKNKPDVGKQIVHVLSFTEYI